MATTAAQQVAELTALGNPKLDAAARSLKKKSQAVTRVAPPPDSSEHKDILDRCLDRITSGEQTQAGYIRGWAENYRAFKAMATSDMPQLEEWQSDVRPGYAYEQMQMLLPRMIDPYPKWACSPYNPRTDRASVRGAERLLDYFGRRDNAALMQARNALQALIYGCSFTKQSWIWREVPRMVRSSALERAAGFDAVREKKLVVDDRPHAEVVHPYDIIWDPQATTMENARWIAHRTYRSLTDLQGMERTSSYKDGKPCVTGQYSNTDKVTTGGQPRNENIPGDIQEEFRKRQGNRVEVWEVHDRIRDRLTTVANRGVVIRDVRMPFLNGELSFTCANPNPDVQRLVGISEVAMLRSVQTMLWLLENQRIDNTRLQMDAIVLVRDGLANIDDLVKEPGAKWELPNPQSDVVFPQMPQPQLASSEDIASMRARLQAITGTSFMGGDAAGFNAATSSGLQAIQEEANRRVDFRLMLMRATCYNRIGQQFLGMAQQFLQTQQLPDVPPELIAPAMWVQVADTNGTLNKSMKQMAATSLLQAYTPYLNQPLPDGRVIDVTPALDVLADAYSMDFDQMATMPPPAPPEGPRPPQAREMVNYKDLAAPPANAAQAAMLDQYGIQHDPPQAGPPLAGIPAPNQ